MSAPARGLTAEQLEMLLRSLSPNRVRQHKGNAHLEAWDVRKWLTRIFGFGGWSDEILTCEPVHSVIWPVMENGKEVPGKHRCTAVYRVTLRLTIRDVQGNVIGQFDDAATGEGINQTSVGDAHDLALKSAVSQALKRCAVNLGDQFGLSLYNDGSTDAVVMRTLGHPGLMQSADEVEDAPVVGGELAEQDAADEKGMDSIHAPGELDEQVPGIQTPEPEPQDVPQSAPSTWDTDEGKQLLKVLHTVIFRKYGPKTDAERHEAFTRFTGRQITSAKQLTRDEAERFIAALRKQADYVKPQQPARPAPKQAADGNENFRQAEALLKLQQDQEAQQLEDDLRDEVESAANPNDLAAAMSMAVALRDEGRLSKEQYARLAAAADERAARARKQLATVTR